MLTIFCTFFLNLNFNFQSKCQRKLQDETLGRSQINIDVSLYILESDDYNRILFQIKSLSSEILKCIVDIQYFVLGLFSAIYSFLSFSVFWTVYFSNIQKPKELAHVL